MTDLLSRLLASRDWIMADGATGTNLFNMGLSAGDAPEFWNVDEPDKIHDALQAARSMRAATSSSPTPSAAMPRG